MTSIKEQLRKLIDEAEAIIIGAGSGLSTAAGFNYGGKRFLKYFKYMNDMYGYTDMYSAGFHQFKTIEEYWGFWSRNIYINRYLEEENGIYKKLYNIIKNKNYFVITTNVDHQFQMVGFDKERLFYTQGDYGLFQCSRPCHNKTYDNKEQILKMVNLIKDNSIPSNLIPRCPICNELMIPNLRCDEKFVEDEGWHLAQERYLNFIKSNKDKKILFLELGVGWNTPVIIKYPFIQMTYQFLNAKYVCINKGFNKIIKEIQNRSIVINEDINQILYDI